MKQLFFMLLLMVSMVQSSNAQGWYSAPARNSGYTRSQSSNASITIKNRSDYSLTVKIMKTGGRGVYRTVRISPNSSSYVTFSSNDSYYTKTKAEKSGLLSSTLYRKGGSFSVQCNSNGYTEGTLEFYVSSTGSGASGQGISRYEFDSDK